MAIPKEAVPLAMVRTYIFHYYPIIWDIWQKIYGEVQCAPTFMRFCNFLTTGQQQPSFIWVLPVLEKAIPVHIHSVSFGEVEIYLETSLEWLELSTICCIYSCLHEQCSVWFHFHMNKAEIMSKSILSSGYHCEWTWIYWWMCIFVWISHQMWFC